MSEIWVESVRADGRRRSRRRRGWWSLVAGATALASLAGCEIEQGPMEPGALEPPQQVSARADWVLDGWQETDPRGEPVVDLSWRVPAQWNEGPFRVYARRVGGSEVLAATVTNCTAGSCSYVDRNVAAGTSYDYLIASVDEATEGEGRSEWVRVAVPELDPPAAPTSLGVTALDGALYLRWKDGGGPDEVLKYLVYMVGLEGKEQLYRVAETDATGYLDLRAVNGAEYVYRVAAMDRDGHVGRMSDPSAGVARPDARGALIRAAATPTEDSGFHFPHDQSTSPILSGSAAGAQWRLERDATGVWIRPLGPTGQVTGVYDAGPTSALVCGPQADPGCTAVTLAPVSGYTSDPLPATPGHSYVFRVRESDGWHHGVVRVVGLETGADGALRAVLEWAYQLRVDDRRLTTIPQ